MVVGSVVGSSISPGKSVKLLASVWTVQSCAYFPSLSITFPPPHPPKLDGLSAGRCSGAFWSSSGRWRSCGRSSQFSGLGVRRLPTPATPEAPKAKSEASEKAWGLRCQNFASRSSGTSKPSGWSCVRWGREWSRRQSRRMSSGHGFHRVCPFFWEGATHVEKLTPTLTELRTSGARSLPAAALRAGAAARGAGPMSSELPMLATPLEPGGSLGTF